MRLRAPVGDREVLLQPAKEELRAVVRRNRQRLSGYDLVTAGRSFAQLRLGMRRRVLALADEYMEQLTGRRLDPIDVDSPLVMTGHQPEICHPGVWIKNFVTDRLAHAMGGSGLALVLDSDLPHSLGLTVPRRARDGAAIEAFVYAAAQPGKTYEQHRPDDSWDVEGFVRAVGSSMPLANDETLFGSFSEAMKRARSQATTAADLVTRARFRVERDAGLANREVPASRVCSTPEFFLFLLDIIVDLAGFARVYNKALAFYRKVHHVRGRANPLPDLEPDEAPFWAYGTDEPRQPLRVRPERGGLRLLAGRSEFFDIDQGELAGLRAGRAEVFDALAERLSREADLVRIRTRALTTTILLRLFVADVFIHGIGGAKYDTVTDEIVRQYYGVEPPDFITVSATLRLPLEPFPGSEEEERQLTHLIRDLRYNPDRHLPEREAEAPAVRVLMRRKGDLIGRKGRTARERREIFEAIRAVNDELARGVAEQLRAAHGKLDEVRRYVGFNRLLQRRDYAFVLYRSDEILGFYNRALEGMEENH